MSTFCSLLKDNCKDGKEHNIDVAIDVINDNQLRIGCLECEREIIIKINKKQFEELYKFEREDYKK